MKQNDFEKTIESILKEATTWGSGEYLENAIFMGGAYHKKTYGKGSIANTAHHTRAKAIRYFRPRNAQSHFENWQENEDILLGRYDAIGTPPIQAGHLPQH